jgi:uncharacterized protein
VKVLCKIYKSLSKADYYLFVKHDEDMSRVPDSLLSYFGKHELAMTLALSPEQKLAVASASEVLESLQENGYFLQLPPQSNEEYMQDIRTKNEKL